MMKILSAASVLAIAAGAHAAPFKVISHTAGGAVPGISGPGIYVSAQGFFDADGAGPGSTSANGFTAANNFEFDSYVALSGVGPSVRNRATVGVTNNSTTTLNFYQTGYPAANNNPALGDYNVPGGTFGPGSHVGDLFLSEGDNVLGSEYGLGSVPPDTDSGFAPNVGGGRSTLDGVFVGRYTIPAGATLTGGLILNVRVGNTAAFESGTLMLSGVDNVAGPGVTIVGQQMALTAFLVTNIADGVLVGNSDENAFDNFGAARVLDLWAHVVPTPGSLALLGLGGLAAVRRRRA